MKAHNIDQLNQDFKQNGKTKHKIVGIQTWHLNLNPLAMSQLTFSKGEKSLIWTWGIMLIGEVHLRLKLEP